MIRRRWVVSYPQYYVGKLDQIGLAFDFSETPGRIQGPPLVVGEQTAAIMAELGYSPGDVEALHKERVLMAWAPEAGSAQALPENPWAKKAATGR